jgi:hypothetical protein
VDAEKAAAARRRPRRYAKGEAAYFFAFFFIVFFFAAGFFVAFFFAAIVFPPRNSQFSVGGSDSRIRQVVRRLARPDHTRQGTGARFSRVPAPSIALERVVARSPFTIGDRRGCPPAVP